jgi:hypothetical protein
MASFAANLSNAISLDHFPVGLWIPPLCSHGALLPGPTTRTRIPLKHLDRFGASIRSFVQDAESASPAEYVIPDLISRYGFQKRRLYDVTSVLGAIGSCRKMSVHSVFWEGLSKVRDTLRRLQSEAGADSPCNALDDIVQSDTKVSIAKLTVAFLLCFLTLRRQTLDIRHVSLYICRKNGRYKSTLCKLYQIAHILDAAGIVVKAETPGDITLAAEFFAPLELKMDSKEKPFSIGSLLNTIQEEDMSVIERRRLDFEEQFQNSASAPIAG